MTKYLHDLYAHFIANFKANCKEELITVSDRKTRIKDYIVYKKDPLGTVQELTINYVKVRVRVTELMSYLRWKSILEHYAILGRKKIIQGNILVLGMGMGCIRIVQIERNHRRRQVNFHETAKQPKVMKDGKLKAARVIYFTDDFYLKIKHFRGTRIKNNSGYDFKASGGNGPGRGFKGEMVMRVKAHPELLLKYPKYKRYLK